MEHLLSMVKALGFISIQGKRGGGGEWEAQHTGTFLPSPMLCSNAQTPGGRGKLTPTSSSDSACVLCA